MIFLWLLFGIITKINGLDSSLVSPCPKAFVYRYQDSSKYTWYGTLWITSDSDSFVIKTIRVLLDSEAESLQLYDHKSSRATVDTFDYTEFLIEGLEEKVTKDNTISVTIALKYKSSGSVPKLTAFRVNEATICSPIAAPGLDGDIQIVKPASTTSRPSSISTILNEESNSVWTSRPAVSPPRPQISGFQPSVSQVEACGTRVQDVTPLIINGRPSRRGQWPWHGALYAVEVKGPQYRCGVTLISRRFAITAAHCVCVTLHSKETVEAQKLLLVFGRMHLSRWHDTGSQDIQADTVIIHSKYNQTNFRNDLAIVRLAEPVEITPWVRTACLWPDKADPSIKLLSKHKGTIVGWGFTSKGIISELLLHAEVPVIEPFECAATNPLFYWRYLSEKSFCAGILDSTSACNGDSGGGMVFRRPATDIWQLRGVVSLSALDRDANTCDIRQYAVFTDLAWYLPWIHQHTDV